MNVLPFLVGTGTLVARSYPDQTVASVKFVPWQMVSILSSILVIGLVAGLCVPVLPFEIPRRGFGLYSWVALLKSQACRGTIVTHISDINLVIGATGGTHA
jgi:hypothetical protein